MVAHSSVFQLFIRSEFYVPLEALQLKVWSLNVGHSQPQLFSDLLVWFLGGCQHGSRSLAQESVEVSRYLPYSNSNMIGLLTTGLRQLIYSLLVIGLIEKSVGRMDISCARLMMGQQPQNMSLAGIHVMYR